MGTIAMPICLTLLQIFMALIPIVIILEEKDVVMVVNDSKTIKHADYPNKPVQRIRKMQMSYLNNCLISTFQI